MGADFTLSGPDLMARCRLETFRSSGPGGQHANRTSSAVRLTHVASQVTASCQDHRSQHDNLRDALARLRLRLAIAQRGCSDPAWIEPYRQGRQIRARSGAQAYHLLAAACLDALDAAAGQVAAAARGLGVSSSQFAAVLADDQEVRREADRLRANHGLGPMLVRR